MGAEINFPSATTSNFWGVPISVYDIFRLQIVRTGSTLSLEYYDEGGQLHNMLTATGTGLDSPAEFSLLLSYDGPFGNHTVSDFGWFDNLAISADQLVPVPEPQTNVLILFFVLGLIIKKWMR